MSTQYVPMIVNPIIETGQNLSKIYEVTILIAREAHFLVIAI